MVVIVKKPVVYGLCQDLNSDCYICLQANNLASKKQKEHSIHVHKATMQMVISLYVAYSECKTGVQLLFLAHLSRRLTGELIVYPCSIVRPSVVRPSSVVHNFKDLLL